MTTRMMRRLGGWGYGVSTMRSVSMRCRGSASSYIHSWALQSIRLKKRGTTATRARNAENDNVSTNILTTTEMS